MRMACKSFSLFKNLCLSLSLSVLCACELISRVRVNLTLNLCPVSRQCGFYCSRFVLLSANVTCNILMKTLVC